MAYQTGPEPLFQADMKTVVHKRGRELIGFALLGTAVLLTMMLATYSPEDPSWVSVTSDPAHNALGGFGAALASPLMMTLGWAAWGLPLAFATWGIRFILHKGEGRVIARALFTPVAIAISAIFIATFEPSLGWTHGFGLGGLFGDAVLGLMIDMMPMDVDFGLLLLSVLLGVLTLSTTLYVLGFSGAELRYIKKNFVIALILGYASIVAFLSLSFRTVGRVLTAGKSKYDGYQEMRSVRAAEVASQPIQNVNTPPVEAPKPSIFNRIMPAPVAQEHANESLEVLDDLPVEDDRIKSRINQAIRNKVIRARTLKAEPETHAQAPLEPAIFSRHSNTAPMLEDVSSNVEEDQVIEPNLKLEEPVFTAPVTPTMTPRSVVQPQTLKTPKPSTKARAEAQPSLSFDNIRPEYEIPALSLLSSPSTIVRQPLSNEALEENARLLESVLDDYGVKGEIVAVRPGPVVTQYELEPAPGLKASRVVGLADDIARSMSALAARVSTVPGRSVIGIELPNENRETVLLREILATTGFGDGNQSLPLALGKDIAGEPIVANLAKMPHLLIAGTTGSGKSVAINTMILSLLYKLTPEECRLIMIDPKMLELSVYDGIPHLLSPVVTDPKKAVVALKWTVGEMEERYRKMSKMGVRNIDGYNGRVADALEKGEDFARTVQTGFDDATGEPVFETETFTPEKMPYIVVIVDEMADLMMVAGKEIEACIQRLAQMARASGIHLVMATQRPSVDVITGTIKANFPTRISFQVTSKIDSRTILGEMGAEQLLGMGDMLYMAGGGKVTRIHAPFVSDEEVEDVVNHLKSFGVPEYVSGVVEGPAEEKGSSIDAVLGLGGNTDGADALYDQAVGIIIKDRKCSTSYIQRKLAIGYNKAARLVEQMEDEGVVSSANHVGKREILVPEQH